MSTTSTDRLDHVLADALAPGVQLADADTTAPVEEELRRTMSASTVSQRLADLARNGSVHAYADLEPLDPPPTAEEVHTVRVDQALGEPGDARGRAVAKLIDALEHVALIDLAARHQRRAQLAEVADQVRAQSVRLAELRAGHPLHLDSAA